MASCPVQPIVDAGKGFAALSERDSWPVLLQLLCNILLAMSPMANCDPNTLLSAGKDFMKLSEKESWSVELQLLCEILNAGATGVTCIIGCSSSGPAVAGPCAFSLAYSPGPNPGFWMWDASRGVWDEIIAPGP